MKKIKFKCEVEDGARWSEVVSEFLKYLSKKYGYTIDEYDMLTMVWSSRLDKLGKMFNEDNSSPVLRRVFAETVRKQLACQKYAARLRRDYRKICETLMPGGEEEELSKCKINKLKALIDKLNNPLDKTTEIILDEILEKFGDIDEY